MNPDMCARGDSIRIRICVESGVKSGKKSLRIECANSQLIVKPMRTLI